MTSWGSRWTSLPRVAPPTKRPSSRGGHQSRGHDELVKSILQFLALERIMAWKIEAGAIGHHGHGFRPGAPPGHWDIAGLFPDAIAFFVEAKTGKADLTADQKAFSSNIGAYTGGKTWFVVARSVDDCGILVTKANQVRWMQRGEP